VILSLKLARGVASINSCWPGHASHEILNVMVLFGEAVVNVEARVTTRPIK
jgi:hypothetical protein